jgi:hypothetical protein
MPKKRTTSQVIGEIGEALFIKYALKNGLIPTKVKNDYGIDFLCQLTNDFGLSRKHTVKFSVVGAVVRTSNAKAPRFRLSKDEVESILKADFPILLILVVLRKELVYHRFFDLELMDTFYETLRDGRATFTLKTRKMNIDAIAFKNIVDLVTNAGYQNRMRMKFLRLNLQKLVGVNKITCIQGEDGNIAVITVSGLENIFDQTRPEYVTVREAFLSHEYEKGIEIPERSIKDAFLNDLVSKFSRTIVVTESSQMGEKVLTLRRNARICAQCAFEFRIFGDEYAFYHKAGISIVFSKRRLSNSGDYHHHLETIIRDSKSDLLFQHSDLVKFLQNCTPGTQICFDRNEKRGIDVSNWPNLVEIGAVIKKVESINNTLGVQEPYFELRHVRNYSLMRHYAFLNALLSSDSLLFGGFLTESDEDKLDWQSGVTIVPFLFQTVEGKLLIEIEYESQIATRRDTSTAYPVGFRLKKKRYLKAWQYEEITVDVEHPTVVITNDISFEIREKEYKEVKRTMHTGIRYYFTRNLQERQ